jgi:hypothetical protein
MVVALHQSLLLTWISSLSQVAVLVVHTQAVAVVLVVCDAQ